MNKVENYFDVSNLAFRDIFDGIENVWEVLGKIKEYLKSKTDFSIECDVPDGAWLYNRDKISIGKGTVIEDGVTITGPVMIGENCTIRQGAYIRGQLLAGDGCVIGHTTEVKNSIFLNGAKAAHFAYVGDSILGNNVNLGAGTKLANFKVDTGNRLVSVETPDGRLDTGMRKLGAILGDNVEIGCNSVTLPGTLAGKNTLIYPCCVVRGVVKEYSIMKLKQEFEITGKNVVDE